MVRKISDNALKNYLAKTSKPERIARLMERCQEHEKLRASLLDLVTPKDNAKTLTSEIRIHIYRRSGALLQLQPARCERRRGHLGGNTANGKRALGGPVNLGPTVNSPADEAMPSIFPDQGVYSTVRLPFRGIPSRCGSGLAKESLRPCVLP